MRSFSLFLLIALTIPTTLLAQKSNDAASLSCWGTKGSFHSRAVKTPIFSSDAGLAYAEVSAKAITDGAVRNCSNTARLFYATRSSDPKIIWRGHQDFNGLGINLFGWSPTGTLLLFETHTWPYDSDADEVRRGLVFDSATGKVRDLRLESAFAVLFGSKCEFMQTVLGWESDHSIKVRISRTPGTDHYQQVFCVKTPVDYTFDLSTRTATPVR